MSNSTSTSTSPSNASSPAPNSSNNFSAGNGNTSSNSNNNNSNNNHVHPSTDKAMEHQQQHLGNEGASRGGGPKLSRGGGGKAMGAGRGGGVNSNSNSNNNSKPFGGVAPPTTAELEKRAAEQQKKNSAAENSAPATAEAAASAAAAAASGDSSVPSGKFTTTATTGASPPHAAAAAAAGNVNSNNNNGGTGRGSNRTTGTRRSERDGGDDFPDAVGSGDDDDNNEPSLEHKTRARGTAAAAAAAAAAADGNSGGDVDPQAAPDSTVLDTLPPSNPATVKAIYDTWRANRYVWPSSEHAPYFVTVSCAVEMRQVEAMQKKYGNRLVLVTHAADPFKSASAGVRRPGFLGRLHQAAMHAGLLHFISGRANSVPMMLIGMIGEEPWAFFADMVQSITSMAAPVYGNKNATLELEPAQPAAAAAAAGGGGGKAERPPRMIDTFVQMPTHLRSHVVRAQPHAECKLRDSLLTVRLLAPESALRHGDTSKPEGSYPEMRKLLGIGDAERITVMPADVWLGDKHMRSMSTVRLKREKDKRYSVEQRLLMAAQLCAVGYFAYLPANDALAICAAKRRGNSNSNTAPLEPQHLAHLRDLKLNDTNVVHRVFTDVRVPGQPPAPKGGNGQQQQQEDAIPVSMEIVIETSLMATADDEKPEEQPSADADEAKTPGAAAAAAASADSASKEKKSKKQQQQQQQPTCVTDSVCKTLVEAVLPVQVLRTHAQVKRRNNTITLLFATRGHVEMLMKHAKDVRLQTFNLSRSGVTAFSECQAIYEMQQKLQEDNAAATGAAAGGGGAAAAPAPAAPAPATAGAAEQTVDAADAGNGNQQ